MTVKIYTFFEVLTVRGFDSQDEAVKAVIENSEKLTKDMIWKVEEVK